MVCARRYRNDLLQYLKGESEDLDAIEDSTSEPVPPLLRDQPVWNITQFFESLPQPFPEDLHHKTACEFNAPSWFNSLLQSARGSRLVADFIWTQNENNGCECSLEFPNHFHDGSYV